MCKHHIVADGHRAAAEPRGVPGWAEDGAALAQLGLFNLASRSFGLSSRKCLKRGDKKDPKSMGWFGLERP